MNLDIRKYIHKNFENTNKEEIKESINSSIAEKEEVTLPGLGVFFENIWKNADEELQNKIIDILEDSLKS